ncbi:hypothetical protein [Nocardia asteroides]|uniref:hypothetical protein n=1 Tax=Nocardia asteroides TaxID=1824 RepID=UPI001E4233AB|nr:hypothetical protein [Nocardia asteroides]UGT59572.1 hypothetical protein LTT61_20250 [Nocardia asteroides]
MRIKSFAMAGLLAAAAVVGVSTAATASAAPEYRTVETIWVGTYSTYAACSADGEYGPAHPDWKYYECVLNYDGEWDLYYSTW